ncbi:hypothetical protein K440DRAFT_565624, partial [Wilcoxina mikolae CBS 423.85]
VEDEPAGYARLAAFIDLDGAFGIVRRFGRLSARNVLLKQDRLCELESQLLKVDQEEDVRFYLCSRRGDKNQQRKLLLDQIHVALKEYSEAISSYVDLRQLSRPTHLNMENFRNYMDGTKPLVEKESQFQYYQDDLVALSSVDDHGTLDDIVHFILGKVFPRRLTLFRTQMRTSDPYIDLYRNGRVNLLSRFVTTIFVVGLLLIPMIVLYNLSTTQSKFLLILFSTLSFTTIMTLLTRVRKSEVFVAAATYCAVLVVFIARGP